ncbi:MAG: PD-(D/E)XK nuclease family protein [Treponemataceae bacterium]|nr:PD-(D/E)XK nuclease family protein [Treponemataceae bacterium]
MQTISETIKTTLKENIKNKKVTFVFPTAVDCDSWSDWILNENIVSAFPLNKFMAWDVFKRECFLGPENKKPVSDIVRKFFIHGLIKENSENCIFSSIIRPEFKDDAYCFTDWLAGLLSELKSWHEKVGQELDQEDRDFKLIYERYLEFLERHDYYEPEWIEKVFDESQGRIFYIFYPEILRDAKNYEQVFQKEKDSIKIISLSSQEWEAYPHPKAIFYQDARKELRRVGLKIRDLALNHDIEWNQIALIVPDLETYTPYIKREFEKYNIPAVIRQGSPLSSNCAGSIFEQISACINENFSYDSVRNLLQNEYLPWTQEKTLLKNKLIQFGCDFRCICSYRTNEGKKLDSWIESLSLAKENSNSSDLEKCLNFYKGLKHDIEDFVQAKSFSQIIEKWISFQGHYIDMEKLKTDEFKLSDCILARCIIELTELKKTEESLSSDGFSFNSHYDFFLNEIRQKKYSQQKKISGVSVFPYRMAVLSNYKATFVINAQQNKVEVNYTQMNFLNAGKKEKLGIQDMNVTSKYLALYNKSPLSDTITFSSCQDAFGGFAIPHSYLDIIDLTDANVDKSPESQAMCKMEIEKLDSQDFFLNEKKLCIQNSKNENLLLTKNQLDEFESWKFKNSKSENSDDNYSDALKEKIMNSVMKPKNASDENECVFTINQTNLKSFFPCQRKWLFKKVLKLKEDSLDTDLVKSFDLGNIYHKILELTFSYLKNNNSILPLTCDNGLFQNEDYYRNLIKEKTQQAFEENDYSFKDFASSSLFRSMIDSQKEKIVEDLMLFMHELCKESKLSTKNVSEKSRRKGFGNWKIEDSELAITKESGPDYQLEGRIDFLISYEDEESDGKDYAIIDFKSGSLPSGFEADSNGRISDFQMQTYTELLQLENPAINIRCEYFYKVKVKENDSSNSKLVIDDFRKDHDFASVISISLPLFKSYKEAYYKKISSYDLEPKNYRNRENISNVDRYSDCNNCDFKTICRSTFVVGNKEIKKGNEA